MENSRSGLDKPLILREETRKKLQKVYGKIVTEEELRELRGDIIAVGDIVASTLLRLGKEPHVIIVDYKTKREEYVDELVKNFGERSVRVQNPAGTITPQLWDAVARALRSGEKWRIEVDGEEDLAVIPVVHLAPLGAIVIYGMPNTGVVMIKVSEKDKDEVNKIIEEMEV